VHREGGGGTWDGSDGKWQKVLTRVERPLSEAEGAG
jgi:hypothetical protein